MKLREYVYGVYLPSKTDLAPSTLAGYMSDITNHVIPRWGDVEIEDIRAKDIQEWVSLMSHGQASNAISALRRILRMAERDDLIAIDPCRKSIQLPKRRTPYIPRYLDKRAVRTLLRGFWGHLLEPYVIVSATCGLRRCEACALMWKDIDLREGRIRIDKGLQTINGEITEWYCKTPSSVRNVYLPMTATRRLREIKGSGPLIPDKNGNRMNPDEVARKYRSWCISNDLPYVPPMYLRHTYVYLAIEAGIPEAVIKEQLGHTFDSAMLREHYFWSGKTIAKNAAKYLDQLLLE